MAEDTIETLEREEELYGLDSRAIPALREAVEAGDLARLTELLEPLHAADIADLLEQVDSELRAAMVELGGGKVVDGDVLSELDDSIRDDVIAALPPDILTDAVRDLESDDVVDLVEDMEEPQQAAILSALEDVDRVAVQQALSYPDYSAGRLMQREVVIAPEHWTVGAAIDFMRANAENLPEQFYHLILVDPKLKPLGQVTLGRILSSPRQTRLTEIVEDGFRTIPVTQPEADVAYAFNQYHLISAPVVDDNGRLVGVITIDDAMIVLDEEHEEDILRLAGVGEESLSDRVLDVARGRFLWLFVNLITAILASVVIAQFEDSITQIVALAVLMPIVASMGGNAGTQSMAVAVRALATRDLTGSNTRRVIRREMIAGLLNGMGFALIMAVVATLWFGQPMIGVVIALAMVLTLVAAAVGGILIPILLERFGVDPALASGPFVTTVTDVVGFFAFLGLGTVILL